MAPTSSPPPMLPLLSCQPLARHHQHPAGPLLPSPHRRTSGRRHHVAAPPVEKKEMPERERVSEREGGERTWAEVEGEGEAAHRRIWIRRLFRRRRRSSGLCRRRLEDEDACGPLPYSSPELEDSEIWCVGRLGDVPRVRARGGRGRGRGAVVPGWAENLRLGQNGVWGTQKTGIPAGIFP